MSLKIEGLELELGGFRLAGIDLELDRGDFFALIGPTGAGKSVLLETLVGLVRPDRGRLFLAGRRLDSLPPERRGIGIVYQDYALFPHLKVRENINYGLRFQGGRGKSRFLVDDLVERLGLSQLLERYPESLSGGEQQRVALARALAVEPEVLLLDEPLSALDPNFRQELRTLLKDLHEASGTTFLLVTHDFAEALFLARRAAVMIGGRIEQVGPIEDIFLHPSSPRVAEFVGMKNLFPVSCSGTSARAGELEIELGRQAGGRAFIAIRPEELVLSPAPIISSMQNSFAGRVVAIRSHGFSSEIDLEAGGLVFTALITSRSFLTLAPEIGKTLHLSFKATAVHLMAP